MTEKGRTEGRDTIETDLGVIIERGTDTGMVVRRESAIGKKNTRIMIGSIEIEVEVPTRRIEIVVVEKENAIAGRGREIIIIKIGSTGIEIETGTKDSDY